MKTRYLLALAGLIFIPAVQAEVTVSKEAVTTAVEAEEDDGRLNLTAEQKAKVQALRAEERAQHEAMRNNYRGKIRALLTPEQQKTFDEHQAARAERREMRDMQTDAMSNMREQRQEMMESTKEQRKDAKETMKEQRKDAHDMKKQMKDSMRPGY